MNLINQISMLTYYINKKSLDNGKLIIHNNISHLKSDNYLEIKGAIVEITNGVLNLKGYYNSFVEVPEQFISNKKIKKLNVDNKKILRLFFTNYVGKHIKILGESKLLDITTSNFTFINIINPYNNG